MSTDQNTSLSRVGQIMVILGWLGALIVLTLVIGNWLETERNPNRNATSVTNADGLRELKLQRNRTGHYFVDGTINGQYVEFLLDTGATDVAVPKHLAERFGLKMGPAHWVQTANGVVQAHATRIPSLTVGDLNFKNVSATILATSDADEVLLGMSVLRELDWSQTGDILTLKQRRTR